MAAKYHFLNLEEMRTNSKNISDGNVKTYWLSNIEFVPTLWLKFLDFGNSRRFSRNVVKKFCYPLIKSYKRFSNQQINQICFEKMNKDYIFRIHGKVVSHLDEHGITRFRNFRNYQR